MTPPAEDPYSRAVGSDEPRRSHPDGAGWLLLPAAAAAWREPRLRPGVAFVCLFSAYVVAVGGDVFGLWRFLLPVLPALAVLAVCGTSALFGWRRGLGVAAAALVAAAVWAQAFGAALPSSESKRESALRSARRLDAAYELGGRRKARVLRERGAPIRLVAATGIGSFGYRSDLPVLDLLGLTDVTIARGPSASRRRGLPIPGHIRSDAEYVLARQPDYILMPRKGSDSPLAAHHDLWEQPEFAARYAWDEALRG